LNWHIVIAFSFCSSFTQTIFAQNVTTPDIQLAESFIASRLNYDDLYMSNFVCVATRQSPYSTYYTFQQYFNQIPIENKMVKVGIDANHQLTVFNGNYQSTKDWTNRAIVAKQLNTAYLLPNGKFS
jgi:Zn-dependent metalloprotease